MIKFKVWEKKQQKWLNHQDFGEKFTVGMHNQILSFTNQEDFEFIQFTGLKDKNGKEIWEGDIVKILKEPSFSSGRKDTLCEVVCLPGYFALKDKRKVSWPIPDDKDTMEIVGNIYENNLLQ